MMQLTVCIKLASTFRNGWSRTSTPQIVRFKHRDKVIFLLFPNTFISCPSQNKGQHFIHVESSAKVQFYGPLDWAGFWV